MKFYGEKEEKNPLEYRFMKCIFRVIIYGTGTEFTPLMKTRQAPCKGRKSAISNDQIHFSLI